ncbi:SDR family oxidoreductase [Streptomyces sp. NA02950]|uniref:SDR family oxidoreductase n=1 Tax=Streptomyces sp. NA02950 TaxID=2742137 RepID=UPI001592795C|nr:SDR family oxidoreductase [Streptomyces sp. NA02950]QKV95209.1 SDR family oxidoreductase [Streptomyces sp. NA02950]
MTDHPVALVTGANKGLGKETARQLAARGITVALGCRDIEHGKAAAHELATAGVAPVPVRLDVTDADSVQDVADWLEAEFGRLDVLVNNAGTVVDQPAEHTTAAVMRQTYEVNVFGAVTMIRTMLPLLGTSRAPRIVNVSSTTASMAMTSGGTDFGGDADMRLAYSSSKAALNMLTVQYAKAFSKNGTLSHLKINSATPGYTATDMTRHRGTRTVTEGARIIVDLATLPEDGPTGGFFNDNGTVPW